MNAGRVVSRRSLSPLLANPGCRACSSPTASGVPSAPVTACAAGAQAIGDAARMIRSGEADIALCGGAEAAIHRVSQAGFAAVSRRCPAPGDQPESASRP
ncbi:hypothetical protein MJ579_15105 [Klebsiella pneumoniae]|nr:hypothetical protein MJ579_15105 [Klebsiella pneumoniae]